MKIKSLGKLAFVFLAAFQGLVFAETLDLFTYAVPKDFKKTEYPSGVMLVNQSETAFTSVNLYASVSGGADPEENFRSEWKRLIVDGLKIEGDVTPQSGSRQGDYQNFAGGTSTAQDGINYTVLLSTFSGNGRAASIVYVTTDEAMYDFFDKFNESVKLSKPKVQAPVKDAVDKQTVQPSRGTIAKPTTNFDDGWVSTVQKDFVRVAKGDTMVLLHYGLPLPENMWVTGNDEERVRYFWEKLVSERYQVDELKVFKNGTCYTCLYYGEGSVTEVATGERKFVALYIDFGGSQGWGIQAISPDFETFHEQFPDIESLGKMYGRNYFAITKADLIGKWEKSSSSVAQYYNTITGADAGMNVVSSSHEFNFNPDGTYLSKHSGASGFVGSQKFFSQEYKGKITISDWKLSLPNRFNGKTDVFDAYFEMTRGGPLLHLTQEDASAITYTLIKQ